MPVFVLSLSLSLPICLYSFFLPSLYLYSFSPPPISCIHPFSLSPPHTCIGSLLPMHINFLMHGHICSFYASCAPAYLSLSYLFLFLSLLHLHIFSLLTVLLSLTVILCFLIMTFTFGNMSVYSCHSNNHYNQ